VAENLFSPGVKVQYQVNERDNITGIVKEE
jgi:hypothetical protein